MKGKLKGKDSIVCTRCNEVLNSKTAIMLELSQTDGNYYEEIPKIMFLKEVFILEKHAQRINLKKLVLKIYVQ